MPDLVEPLTVPFYRPGQDPPLLWVTSDAVRHHDAIAGEPRDELFFHVDYYQIITCPFCDWSKTGPRSRYRSSDVWLDYEHHVSSRHRGKKWAEVTVTGEPEHGHDRRDAGRHFRRHVDVDKIDLMDFSHTDDGSAFKQGYTATFQCGRWRGDISNQRLSDILNRLIDFEAFESVDVHLRHVTPSEPADPDETIDAMRKQHTVAHPREGRADG